MLKWLEHGERYQATYSDKTYTKWRRKNQCVKQDRDEQCAMKRMRFTADIVLCSKKQFPTNSGSEQFKMDIRAEQRATICLYVHLGKSPRETYADMKKAYDSEYLSKMTVN